MLTTTGVAADDTIFAPDVLSSTVGVLSAIIDVVNDVVGAVIPGFNINVASVVLSILDFASSVTGLLGISIPDSASLTEQICNPLTTAIAAQATCTCDSDSSNVEGSFSLGIQLDCTGTSEVCLEDPAFCGTPTFEGVLNVDFTKQSVSNGNFVFTVPSAKSCVNFNAASPAASQPFCIDIPLSATITNDNFDDPVIELDNDSSVTKLGDELCNANVIPCVADQALSVDIDCSNVVTTGGVSGPDPACLDLISFAIVTSRRTLSKQLHLDQLLDSGMN